MNPCEFEGTLVYIVVLGQPGLHSKTLSHPTPYPPPPKKKVTFLVGDGGHFKIATPEYPITGTLLPVAVDFKSSLDLHTHNSLPKK